MPYQPDELPQEFLENFVPSPKALLIVSTPGTYTPSWVQDMFLKRKRKIKVISLMEKKNG